MKRSSLLLLGLVTFMVCVALNAPAQRLHAWLAPTDAALNVHGLRGSLVRGAAAQIELNAQPAFRNLEWNLRGLHLLLGRLSYHLSGGADGMLIDGTAFAVPSGALSLSDFRIRSPLTQLMRSAGYPFVPVVGNAGADIQRLKLRQGWPVDADALITVHDLSWKLGRDPVPLGDYQAVIENETGGIKAIISTLSGNLEVEGEAHARDDRSYEVHLQMKPKPDAPPMVLNMVRNLGQPDVQGWYHLRRKGQSQANVQASPEVQQ